MEFKTLSKVHALVTMEQAEAAAGCIMSGSYIMQMQQPDERERLLSYLFTHTPQQRFSLTLDFNGVLGSVPGTHWLDQLILIFSHPMYLQINARPIVCFVHAGAQTEQLTSMIDKALARHSIAAPAWIDMDRRGAVAGNSLSYAFYLPIATQPLFNTWYFEQLSKADSLLHLFTPFDKNEVDRLQNYLQQAELKLKENNSTLYAMIAKLQARSEQLQEYEQLVGMLTEDLQSKKDYLDFLLGKFKEGGQVSNVDFNQIMQIKQWYYREYEVLPLWYKRFGHIIKVLTGKRTLKSLFSDDVPKYK